MRVLTFITLAAALAGCGPDESRWLPFEEGIELHAEITCEFYPHDGCMESELSDEFVYSDEEYTCYYGSMAWLCREAWERAGVYTASCGFIQPGCLGDQ